MSNGAGFVNILACSPTLSSHFAAFAPHSGAYYLPSSSSPSLPPAECQPARSPLPILSFHGGSDKSVPYDGGAGSGRELPHVMDGWLADWAGRNGCGARQEDDEFGGDVKHFSWTCGGAQGGSGDLVMEHYKIDSMGELKCLLLFISGLFLPLFISSAHLLGRILSPTTTAAYEG